MCVCVCEREREREREREKQVLMYAEMHSVHIYVKSTFTGLNMHPRQIHIMSIIKMDTYLTR